MFQCQISHVSVPGIPCFTTLYLMFQYPVYHVSVPGIECFNAQYPMSQYPVSRVSVPCVSCFSSWYPVFQYLVFPFALHHEAVDLSRVADTWLGTVHASQAGLYLDTCCLLIMGGLPWQVSQLHSLFSDQEPCSVRTCRNLAPRRTAACTPHPTYVACRPGIISGQRDGKSKYRWGRSWVIPRVA